MKLNKYRNHLFRPVIFWVGMVFCCWQRLSTCYIHIRYREKERYGERETERMFSEGRLSHGHWAYAATFVDWLLVLRSCFCCHCSSSGYVCRSRCMCNLLPVLWLLLLCLPLFSLSRSAARFQQITEDSVAASSSIHGVLCEVSEPEQQEHALPLTRRGKHVGEMMLPFRAIQGRQTAWSLW